MSDDAQIEFNLGGGAVSAMNEAAAMDEAVAAAVRSSTLPGQEAPSAETVMAARDKAQELLRNNMEGLKDLQNLTLSMGLPSTRAIFRDMIRGAGLRGIAKDDAMKAVVDFSPVTEVGCLKVDFHNRKTGKGDVAYLLLDQCPRTHNVGKQLDKLKPLVAEAKWPEVLQQLGSLIFMGRSVYGQVARKHLDLIRKIKGLPADDPCTAFLDLQVDMATSTLFVNPDSPNRVGIYIRLESEVKTEKPK